MNDDDDVDDLELLEDATESGDDGCAKDASDGPGLGTILFRVGIALSAVVALLVLGVGVVIVLFAKARNQEQANQPAKVVNFKPGDPLPDPPLPLPEPAAPSSLLGAKDLMQVDPRSLRGAATHFYAKGDFQSAIQCQYLSVIRTDAGRYNLACFYSRAGKVNAALYWLQAGARDEGADVAMTNRDSDFTNLRNDPRWPKLLHYLRIYEKYWEASGISETSLIVPQGTTPQNPIPVFIGLHGLGANASGFLDPESYQPLADKMGVAFLAVSGTHCRGKSNFAWSEDPVSDLARIDAALRETADRFTPAKGKVVLFGFSQGGWLSSELAFRHPERFKGAIILSPGSLSGLQFANSPPGSGHREQGIIAICGAGEHPGTVQCTKTCAIAFDRFGARVYQKLYPDMKTHSFPPGLLGKVADLG